MPTNAPVRPTSIEHAWTQFPECSYTQEELVSQAEAWLPPEKLRLARQVFRRARVATRHMVLPPDQILGLGRSFARKLEKPRRRPWHPHTKGGV